MQPVPDHLRSGLDVVFVGFNPSLKSGETGHHFAGPSNRFWKILFKAGFTPRKYAPEEDAKLLDLGFGLTNIVARPTRAAEEITPHEYAEGRLLLLQKLEAYRPRVACFVGKGVYREFSLRRQIEWGIQEAPVSSSIEFVAPSSSGLVRMPFAEVVGIYSGLKEIISGRRRKKKDRRTPVPT